MSERGMQDEHERALERIRKLLQHAGGEGHHSEEEVNTAMKLARKLMDQFNISESEALKNNEQAREDAYTSIKPEEVYSRAGAIDPFDARLATACDYICDVKHYTSHRYDPKMERGRERQTLMFYGLPRDIHVAKALFHELLVTMRAMARMAVGSGWNKRHVNYCMGFSERLVIRASEILRQSRVEPNSTAIVLVKEKLLDRYAENELNLTTRKLRGSKISDSSAYMAGINSANNVTLNRTWKPIGKLE